MWFFGLKKNLFSNVLVLESQAKMDKACLIDTLIGAPKLDMCQLVCAYVKSYINWLVYEMTILPIVKRMEETGVKRVPNANVCSIILQDPLSD